MKIGIICEGITRGADKKVYEFLAKKILPDINIVSLTLGNKPNLIDECGPTTKNLLEIDKCDLVVITCDLYPRHGEDLQHEGKRNPKDCELIKKDREKIEAKLHNAGLTEAQLQSVKLVCIVKELEAWLLADERAIATYLEERSNTRCETISFKHPEHPINPKGELDRIFTKHIGRKYQDAIDAEKIIYMVEIKKLFKKCPTFRRFALKIAGERIIKQLFGTQPVRNQDY